MEAFLGWQAKENQELQLRNYILESGPFPGKKAKLMTYVTSKEQCTENDNAFLGLTFTCRLQAQGRPELSKG